jgi:peroxiredoxin
MLLMACLRTLFFALVLGLPAVGLAADSASPEPAPDFVLKSLAGENLRLSEYRGQVVLVNFWASWCGHCRSQLSSLEDLHVRYRGADFQLLSVNLDDDIDKARQTHRDYQLSFPVLFDDQKTAARLYDPGKMPMTLLIDTSGAIRHVHEGYRAGDEEHYQRELEALLAE